MSYVICKNCGGYYELQEGESPEDFEVCQCGGSLEYIEKINQKTKEDDKYKLICSNCLKENENGIFCSKCGGKLINIENSKVVNNIRYSNGISAKVSNSAIDQNLQNEFKSLLKRISWIGILAGVGFLLISIVLAGSILKRTRSTGNFDIQGYALTIIVISFLMLIISGFLAAYISKSRDYIDGAINGFIIGLIYFGLGVIMSDTSPWEFLFTMFTLFGGIIGIFVRNELNND